MSPVNDDWWAPISPQRPRHLLVLASQSDSWLRVWREQYRMQPLAEAHRLNPTATFYIISIELPHESVGHAQDPRTIPGHLEIIEKALGVTVKELAQVLCVSRPMIYHWRAGMEPSPENRARIEAITRLAVDWTQLDPTPLGQRLHARQPEGHTLMEWLSNGALDIPVIRSVMERLANTRTVSVSEIATREALLHFLAEDEAAATRLDVVRERQMAGKSSYIGDPTNPGRLIEIQPDGTRRLGRMVKRTFVPDGPE